ncbi:acetylornithine deacetylase [Bordetella ansorpii]|uniref:Acetylornithine deacetylase n=1 Tax=Bordetella ansorpii TaxID=288768 RepID=A0A157R2B4_9BORD|nr:acetylornithine deacetylase [Bordetella ansorpii]SAI52088.1 acetylornithine deacetylase [Bordetella ansorpii]
MNAAHQDTPTDAAVAWIQRLVSIDTTSRNSNLGLIEMVRDDLRRAGIGCHLSHDDSGAKANLYATVPAHDGNVQGGIVLSGHTDTVPVDGQQWDHDPFTPRIHDGKLYGRGTCDMKGFIGTALSLVPRLTATRLSRPVHFALSYDEELGCLGAPVMLADLKARGVQPEGCIVGEPTSMRVIVAHKGINVWRCCVRGQAAHSSLTPRGLNAIEYAARLICFIRDLADEMRRDGPFDQAFDVPFSTAQVGTIQGGIAVNTIPALCQFEFEHRNLPGADPQRFFSRIQDYANNELLPRMRAEHGNAAIELEALAGAPSLDAAEQAAITQLVRALTADRDTRKVAYGTEAGQFQRAGIPSVICGPGDIQQAHRPNEFVALDQITRCAAFLDKVIDNLAQP